MISAGRVLLMPRGAFDANVQYDILDLVSYNGSSYIAFGPTKGNLPTDTTKWMLSAYGGNAANVAGNFAVIETTDIATVTHYEGTLFIDENSQFMKATQIINIGDTIVSGTNCTPTTVEQLLNEITAYVDGLDSQNRKLYGGTEIAAQTDLHSLAIGEYYKSKTTFYVTNGPDGISNVTSAVFRLTIEAALKDGSTASSPLLLTLRTPGGKIYTQNFDGSTWGEWTILSEQIEAAENGISDIVNILGAKNLLKITSEITPSKGITVTNNGDGSITVVGTATADAYFNIMQHDFGNLRFATDGSADNSEYKLSGLPANSNFYIAYNPSNNYVTLVVKPAYGAVDNVTIYPMIRPKNIEDDTWQPYTKTNKELAEEVTQNASDIQTLANETEENTEDIATNLASINILKNNGNWRTGLRFKNLGTSFTAEQATALANGNFSEFWNGDYWVINGHNWRIVDNSGWARRRGDTNFDSNSLVVMPDDNLVLAEAYLIDGGTSGSNTDTHGYANCGYRTDEKSGKGRTQCKTLFQNAFGSSHIASHRELMSTSRGTGGALSWAWQDADVELPSEVNIYGHSVWGSGLEGGVDEPSFNIGDRWGQFMLFRLAPYMAINRGQNYWLRDIHSASNFALVDNHGGANYAPPSVTYVGLRPYSIIK